MRVIAVVNQKGGVGKTTTAAHVGHALSSMFGKTLLIDLDPQGHLQHCLGHHDSNEWGLDLVLSGTAAIADVAHEVRENLDLVPAGPQLSDFEHGSSGADRAFVLRDAIAESGNVYKAAVLDCGPASGMLAANAIAAADDVLIPVAGDYLSLTGLARLLLTLRRMKSMRLGSFNEWVFFSRFTPRRRLSREVFERVSQHFSDRLLSSSIQEAAVLAECAGVGKTIFEYRPGSRSAREYSALVEDLIRGRVVSYEQKETSNVA